MRRGSPDKVLLFFNGGGACWRAADCDPHGRTTYTVRADTANAPAMAGIFDHANPANPLRDYTMVFVPYCTGDVFLGRREVRYTLPGVGGGTAGGAPGRTFAIDHVGSRDAEAALGWVYGAVPHPSVVVVTGASAGAIPSPLFAARVARHYPDARVVQLGDGAGGYGTERVAEILADWGAPEYLRGDPALASIDPKELTFESLYVAAKHEAPRATFAQVNTVDDATQLFFLSLLGVTGQPLGVFLAKDLGVIRRADPGFRSYLAPGRAHTILRGNAMYITTVDGVAFRDWLAALVEGRAVTDVGDGLLPH